MAVSFSKVSTSTSGVRIDTFRAVRDPFLYVSVCSTTEPLASLSVLAGVIV